MILFILSALLLSCVGLAFYFWKQQNQLLSLMNEGAKAYDKLQRHSNAQERRIAKLGQEISESKIREDQIRAQFHLNLKKAAESSQTTEQSLATFEKKLRDVENQRDLAMMEQSKHKAAYEAIFQEKSVLSQNIESHKKQLNDLTNQIRSQNDRQVQSLKSEFETLRNKHLETEKELSIFKARPDLNPRDFDTLKRKVGQYELLYNGMKGQREMMEERAQNWENALKLMSKWILTKSPVAVSANDPVLSDSIGPLVGEALVRIGTEIEVADS
jgi:chromosome segregation ATPase